MLTQINNIRLLKIFQAFIVLICIEGLVVLWLLLRFPSEAQGAVFAGYSLRRVAVGAITLFCLAGLGVIATDSFRSQKILRFLSARLKNILNLDICFILLRSVLTVFFIVSLIYIVPYYVPLLQRLSPLNIYNSLPNYYGLWAAPYIIWILLINLKLISFFSLYGKSRDPIKSVSVPTQLMLISWVSEIFVVIFLGNNLGKQVLILCIWFSTWALFNTKKEWRSYLTLPFTCISIWLLTFLVSLQLAGWLNYWRVPEESYFHLLADAILHGRLYLIAPPSTFDLTFYNGYWFVPVPPFPAIVMLPFVAIWGVAAFNPVIFSLALAATTSVVIYLILKQLPDLHWISLSHSGMLWLVAFFSFGTVFGWLSITGLVYHISQVCTVLFSALSFWFVLKRLPPWLVGLALAAAVMSRPNVILLWPALAAIAIQLQKDDNEFGVIHWKHIFLWSVKSLVPILLAVAFLLYYNYLRFGNFSDFGYLTINGSESTVSRAQEYGIFSPHFIPFNFYSMFFGRTQIVECDFYLTRGFGISMFLASPALLYLLRRFKFSWWTVGCWGSIVLSTALLLMYHNNGSNQYAYRYWMDFSVPVIMLLAYTAGQRISIPLKILIIISILINYYGIISWYKGPC
jgi:hypothetical protein